MSGNPYPHGMRIVGTWDSPYHTWHEQRMIDHIRNLFVDQPADVEIIKWHRDDRNPHISESYSPIVVMFEAVWDA